MSTRRTYEAVADALAWSLAYADGCATEDERTVARAAVAASIHSVATAFALDNPRFDRAMFVGRATLTHDSKWLSSVAAAMLSLDLSPAEAAAVLGDPS